MEVIALERLRLSRCPFIFRQRDMNSKLKVALLIFALASAGLAAVIYHQYENIHDISLNTAHYITQDIRHKVRD